MSTNADARGKVERRPYSAGMGSTPSSAVQSAEHDQEPDARRGERGQGMVEYVFIVVLIAIAVIIALQVLGHTTNTLYSNISNGLNT